MGLAIADLLRRSYQAREFGCGVVRRDATALVAEQILTIFERHSSRAKPPAEGVLQIVDPHSAKSVSCLDSGLEYFHVVSCPPHLRLLSPEQIVREIKRLEAQMYKHARNLEFEEAAKIRDTIEKMKQLELGLIPGEGGADSGRGGRGAA